MTSKRVNVLFLSSEADPYVKIGGLGDVAGALPRAILQQSDENTRFDIRLAIPLYGAIKKKYPALKKLTDFNIHTGSLTIRACVYEHEQEGLPVYLIDGSPIREEDPVYGSNFTADAEKFIFFSLACLELPRVLKWKIDILHANDWHTAIAVHQSAKLRELRPERSRIKKVITLHNLPFMGAGSEEALTKFGIEPAEDSALPIWARTIPLPMGLASADRIVPVSPTYAEEILTPEFGCGLENYLSTHKEKITGIINGIDSAAWNPASDPFITPHFDHNDLPGKARCKQTVQKEMGLPVDPATPLIVVISRMDQQKGIDLAIDALRSLSGQNWQAVILGSGDAKLESAALSLQNDLPEKVRARVVFDPQLSHRLYAGTDILLMPSRYEPCGLAQMIAMRYGTVPVARATGGLKDTISDYTQDEQGNGFTFAEASGAAAARSLATAFEHYQNKTTWGKIVANGMKRDFSWAESAKKYCQLYHEVLTLPVQEEK